MPQRKQITWAQLRVGLLMISSLAIFALGIFFISGRVGFLSRRYTLRTYLSDAGGLREGAQVRLAGVPVGNVQRIRITSSPEAQRAVEITMKITSAYREQIRGGSVARLETAGLLGESYVDVSRGTPGQPVVLDQGEVPSHEEADIKKIVQNTNDVLTNLSGLSAKLNDVTTQIQSGKGTLGMLIYDPTFYNRLNSMASDLGALMDRVEKGQGSLGKFANDETLYQHAVATIDHVDRVVEDIEHGKGSMAKFISDPSFYNEAHQFIGRANSFMDNVNQGHGTLGKLATDATLYNRMNNAVQRFDVVTQRVQEGQGTLGKLSTDATLYSNLSESAKSLRDFLVEFRKDPKKYLTLHLRIF